MTKSIFEFSDYKEYLKYLIKNNERGIVKRLADAAKCQRSYLSQSLSSQVNLTPDHLYGIGTFLQLNEIEIDYLLLMLEKERSGSFLYQKKIKEKMLKLSKKNKKISNRIFESKKNKVDDAYYSAWFYAALHIATSIPSLKTESDFSKYLNLPKQLISNSLRKLEKWGLIKQEEGQWNYRGESTLHLKDSSLLTRMNHTNWRNRSFLKELNPRRDLHYTSVFAASNEDIKLLREDLIKFLTEQRGKIGKSNSENLVSFCCDFFHVSDLEE